MASVKRLLVLRSVWKGALTSGVCAFNMDLYHGSTTKFGYLFVVSHLGMKRNSVRLDAAGHVPNL